MDKKLHPDELSWKEVLGAHSREMIEFGLGRFLEKDLSSEISDERYEQYRNYKREQLDA